MSDEAIQAETNQAILTDSKEEKPSTSSGLKAVKSASEAQLNFVPGSLLEARDFADNWFLSKVVEVDVDGREVLVHFQNWSSRYDEWISMDSSRLRPVTNQSEKLTTTKGGRGNKELKVGEKVMAVWHNNKRYPAQITKILEPGNFEVIFYDGFIMQVKAKQMTRIPKDQADKMEIPFPPQTTDGDKQTNQQLPDMEEIGSKEERRKRKKKIEVADLFRYYKKRPSTDAKEGGPPVSRNDSPSSLLKDENPSPEKCETPSIPTPTPMEKPVVEGINVDAEQKKKKKKRNKEKKTEPTPKDEKKERLFMKDHGDIVKLNDEKLPEGFEKRAKYKICGSKAGKWDVVIIGPDGRTFRSKQDIKQYLFVKGLDHDLDLFDFRLGEDFYTRQGLEVPARARTNRTPVAAPVKKEVTEAPIITPTRMFEASQPPADPSTPVAPGSEPPLTDKTSLSLAQPKSTPMKNEQVAGTSIEHESLGFFPGEDGYRCPLEDCRKLFRRDNLLVMHIKHYHPALLKKLGCKTVRVEDLAAARTAFETEEVVKPAASIAQTHSILASILTMPPQASPSPPPSFSRLRPSLERKIEKEKEKLSNSPASDDLQNLPLSKRLSLSESGAKILSPKSASRRRGDKRPAELQMCDLHHEALSELEAEMDFGERKGPEESPIVKDEPFISMLDDIPGQKELVHCFCGSPEEDGLMIQCELCLCWQHGICLSIDTEENVPDPYVCYFCRYPFRERLSRRYTHDQTWLKKGHLPSLKFISGSSSVPADHTLRVAHTLTAAATDLKQLLHSLKVKIDVAKNKDHPKLYLWAQPWNHNKKIDQDVTNLETASNNSQDESKPLIPNIPLPETPIDATDCRLNLLLHIADMQNEVDTRLESLEGLFEECETEESPLMETSHVAKMLQILLKDVVTLKRMASFSWSS